MTFTQVRSIIGLIGLLLVLLGIWMSPILPDQTVATFVNRVLGTFSGISAMLFLSTGLGFLIASLSASPTRILPSPINSLRGALLDRGTILILVVFFSGAGYLFFQDLVAQALMTIFFVLFFCLSMIVCNVVHLWLKRNAY